MTRQVALRLLPAVLLALTLAACSSSRGPGPAGPGYTPEERDGAPHPGRIPDLSRVPEPVPRVEPPSRYGNPASYVVFGRRYTTLDSAEGYRERGVASWYGTKFHGRRTSSGEPYDMFAMTAAHTSLPLPTYARVTNLENGRSVVVRVNDRGPFVDNRIIDLSYAAAHRIGMLGEGTARVEVKALIPEPSRPEVMQAGWAGQDAPAGQVESDPGEPVFLQVGAFSSRVNAERLRDRLHARLEQVAVLEGGQADTPLYRVRVGPLSDVRSKRETVRILQSMGLGDYRVVTD
ncbi:septal ring lytic transglycosylase RlpA family protein [Ectothiorhodospira lacustris]|uniref:septal ring lytic transglycosylase RlpA family protein n=1 Tax=Ectothiorhodospira lacustris TaxID=2899127 RepID=UPI001EE7911F|nr:septal ring lytic transglycosylase RlpA family protein [Ectothiorhodospira lacustris]